MNATLAPVESSPLEQLHDRFLELLPRIEAHAKIFFRYLAGARKDDALAEVAALSWKWYCRLAEQGKDAAAFVSALADFACRAVRDGRSLTGQSRINDALSPRAQRRRGFSVIRLPERSSARIWSEALADNTVTPPDEQAAFRIDFDSWRGAHSPRDRQIMDEMVMGERTLDLSRRFGISAGRVSQLRREFHDDWRRFQGEPEVADDSTAA